jgi:carboxymethylenebutenolidase
MCYDDNARVPIPPVSGGSGDGHDIVLTAADGNKFSAYIAYSSQADGPQVLIYPDIRGLHQFYKELALRFAEAGIRALALDYFGRTAGLSSRAEPFDWQPHVAAMTIPTFLTDVTAALAYLKSQSKIPRKTFIVGFCRGGTLALHTAAEQFDLTGIIAFYAGLSRSITGEKGTALVQAGKARYPVLGLFGGADQGIPPDQVQELDKQLGVAGVAREIVSYPGAPHSFFDRRFEEFADASTDAWKRILNFIATGKPKT